MKVERACNLVREELSARLDGEADESMTTIVDRHLESCAACRAHEKRLWVVRRAVRAQPAGPVPDLSDRILAEVAQERNLKQPRRLRHERVRYAVVGAAASIVLLIAASLPWSNRADTATAASLVEGVRSAARMLDSYQASFTVRETGWLNEVPDRRFQIDLAYMAPEAVALRIKDRTTYPTARWPRNNVVLVSDGSAFSITAPATCPRDALPDCSPGTIERRAIENRQPFDGIYRLPTDAILPLTTLASSEGLDVRGSETILDRSTHVVALPYGQAVPLVEAFQAGGSWRGFHPSDEVQVWLDRETWFPLAVEVRAGGSADRAEWAVRNSYRDRPGDVLLRIEATTLSESRPPSSSFLVEQKGSVRPGGFRARSVSALDPRLIPADLQGLEPYRAGRVGPRTIVAWTDGMSYLKLVEGPITTTGDALTAEEVLLPGTGPAYYLPASERDPRRLSMFTNKRELRIESNLPRAELLGIASSIRVQTKRLAPREVTTGKGIAARRVDPEGLRGIDMAPEPHWMPEGYEPRVGLVSTGPSDRRTLTVFYRRAEAEIGGFGIRITRSRPADLLTPSSKELITTPITRDLEGRWSVERAELEWIEGDTYNAIAVPGFDRATAVRIARSVR